LPNDPTQSFDVQPYLIFLVSEETKFAINKFEFVLLQHTEEKSKMNDTTSLSPSHTSTSTSSSNWTIQSFEVDENDIDTIVTNVVTFVHINDHHSHVDEHELVLPVRELPHDIVQRIKMFRDSISVHPSCDYLPTTNMNANSSTNSSTSAMDAADTCPPPQSSLHQQIVIRYGRSYS
jgi:hypothetical protein